MPPAGLQITEGRFVTPEAALAAAGQARAPWDIFLGLVQEESHFVAGARSSAGAVGPAQVIHGPTDPWQNLLRGAQILVEDVRHFGGDVRLGLAAYNAGVGAVERAHGIPYAETRSYVDRVIADSRRFAAEGPARAADDIRTLDRFPESPARPLSTATTGGAGAVSSPYVFPLPAAVKFTQGRIDMGLDIETGQAGVGQPILAIGNAKVVHVGAATGFGPSYLVYELLEGPQKGKRIYVGHSGPALVKTGQVVNAGQPLVLIHGGTGYGGQPGHIEMGYATGVNPSALATYREGQQTAAGQQFTSFWSQLRQLPGIVGGILGGDPNVNPGAAFNQAFGGIGNALHFVDLFFQKLGDLFSDPIRILEIVAGLGLVVIGIRVLSQWVTSSSFGFAGGSRSVGGLRIRTPALAL